MCHEVLLPGTAGTWNPEGAYHAGLSCGKNDGHALQVRHGWVKNPLQPSILDGKIIELARELSGKPCLKQPEGNPFLNGLFSPKHPRIGVKIYRKPKHC